MYSAPRYSSVWPFWRPKPLTLSVDSPACVFLYPVYFFLQYSVLCFCPPILSHTSSIRLFCRSLFLHCLLISGACFFFVFCVLFFSFCLLLLHVYFFPSIQFSASSRYICLGCPSFCLFIMFLIFHLRPHFTVQHSQFVSPVNSKLTMWSTWKCIVISKQRYSTLTLTHLYSNVT